MVSIAGAIIGGIGSALGGLFGGGSQRKAQESANRLNKEALQHGVRWRVKDAKAAGIHPLAALGANVAGPYAMAAGSGAFGDAIAGGAQAIGDAVSRRLTPVEAEHAQLQNELLRSQISQSDAATADLLSSAQSRSQISALRSIAIGGAAPSLSVPTPHERGDDFHNQVYNAYGPIVGAVAGLGHAGDFIADAAKRGASSVYRKASKPAVPRKRVRPRYFPGQSQVR